MALVINGNEYVIKTPDECAIEVVEYLNKYLSDNNIQDENGDLLQIEINNTNPLYIILYGLGYLTSVLQKLIHSAASGVSISESADRQLLNLAQLAKIKRKEPTRTTILATIYADSPGPDAQQCVITKELSATLMVAGQRVVFHPAYDVTIPIGGASTMVLVSELAAPYTLAANTITQFDTVVPGFRTMQTESSVPGQSEETIGELRTRIQSLSTARTQIDSAAEDISALDGVTMANVYFNYSSTDAQTISGISVPPRQALIIVQGYNDNIATAFYNNMLCMTAGKGNARAIQQDYVTLAGQKIETFFIPPTNVDVYMRIYVGTKLTQENIQAIKDAIITRSRVQRIGQSVSAGDILRLCGELVPSIMIQDVELSRGETSGYSYHVQPAADELLIFNANNMKVMQ